jgi:enoyl-CoA hydratase/carnithine racemase
VERDDPMMKNDVLLTERSGNVLVLTLNRPEVRNALNPELKDRLIDAMHGADDDPDIRAIVLTGNGPVFCAGMDLKGRHAAGADFGGLSLFYSQGFAKPVIAALAYARDRRGGTVPHAPLMIFAGRRSGHCCNKGEITLNL